MPVSRETPPAPDVARGVFGAALPKAEAFAELLATAGVERGLIGPRETPRLWERHLVNCALLGDAIPPGSAVCDIGSGAGLPGLILALTRADLTVTLVEPLLRRSVFLEEAVDVLALENVTVLRARAEELHGSTRLAELTEAGRGFDVVASRAVAPLPRLLDWSMPLVRAGGVVAAMKGASAEEELAGSTAALRRHGARRAEVVRYGLGTVDPPTTVIRVEATRDGGLGSARSAVSRTAPVPGPASTNKRKRGRRDRGSSSRGEPESGAGNVRRSGTSARAGKKGGRG